MVSLWFRSALLPDGWAADVRVTVAAQTIARIETKLTEQRRKAG